MEDLFLGSEVNLAVINTAMVVKLLVALARAGFSDENFQTPNPQSRRLFFQKRLPSKPPM
jgi:hypothetical protein